MITGFFDGLEPQPFVWIALRIESFGDGFAPIPFMVDTGAVRTTLHALDAIRYFGLDPARLDSQHWSHRVEMNGVGGAALYQEWPAVFGLAHDDGRLERIDGSILLGDLATGPLPSLLGWDILRLLHVDLHGPNRTIRMDVP